MKFCYVIFFCSSCREIIKMIIVYYGFKLILRFNKLMIEILNFIVLWIID